MLETGILMTNADGLERRHFWSVFSEKRSKAGCGASPALFCMYLDGLLLLNLLTKSAILVRAKIGR